MTVRFIADLHLSPARPDITALFLAFLANDAKRSSALYILGDLFDAWLGDDDTSSFAAEVKTALKSVTTAGVPVYFMAGNRDFLIGEQFSAETGVKVLPEGHVVNLFGTPTLLLHGDTLCTRDQNYQRFRKLIRAPIVTAFLTRLPLSWRMRIARKLRQSSATQRTLSDADLERMDAVPEAVVAALESVGVTRVIHGHTHRPKVHQHHLSDGRTAERIVLGDWYEQGSVLEVYRENFQLLTLPLAHRYENGNSDLTAE